jgi:excisionase family DNA binding protein
VNSPRARLLPLGEASALLGIAPKTLRRWANEGRVPVVTTQGGHRRFQRDVLERIGRGGPAAARSNAALLAERIGAMTRVASEHGGLDGEVGGIADGADRAVMGDRGRAVLRALLDHLATRGRPAAHYLEEACVLGVEYGRHLARLDVPLLSVVTGFSGFNATLTAEVAVTLRRRGPGGRDPVDLMVATQNASHRVLLAILQGYSETADDDTEGDARAAPGPLSGG